MNILTFNWHEAYISTLAKTGHHFHIVERPKGGSAIWFYETRPVPPNAEIVKESTARAHVRDGLYDLVVCQNVGDLAWAREYGLPKVLVFHNMLTTELALGGNTVPRATHLNEVRSLIDGRSDVHLVFISETKARDWGMSGRVIPPGIDLDDYGGYTGDEVRVLRVGNFMKRRDLMLGYSAQREILGDLPSTLLGLNEPEDGARFTRSWDDLKACFRSHRVYLNTTVDGFEDGYNLSMLEAMATGMPVVSTANRTSPIRDGENGFVSGDLRQLGGRVRELLNDIELARRIGVRARETVATMFSMDRFVERWNDVFDDAARGPQKVRATRTKDNADLARAVSASRKRILLNYVSYPATTAAYLEKAFRRSHEVVTIGPAMGADLIRAWNLQDMNRPVVAHDIPCQGDVDLEPIVDKLAAQWTPDLYLWVESVYGNFPRGIERLACPTACYLIDSHLNLPWHLEWARKFDHVFVAQREYVPDFRRAGCPRVAWLPLGCDPEVHRRHPGPKLHDIGFVGSITEHHKTRRERIDRLKRRFDVHVERSFFDRMAQTLSASRIVFNDAVKRDLNMRVFEVLACGSFLLTDRAEPSGLDELFLDRRHLAIYDDDNHLEDLAAHYLQNEGEREAIAEAGRREALAWHTYAHRATSLLDAVFGESHERVSVDAGHLAYVDDPLVLRIAELAAARQDEAVAALLPFAQHQRDLFPAERALLHTTASRCLKRLGQGGVVLRLHD